MFFAVDVLHVASVKLCDVMQNVRCMPVSVGLLDPSGDMIVFSSVKNDVSLCSCSSCVVFKGELQTTGFLQVSSIVWYLHKKSVSCKLAGVVRPAKTDRNARSARANRSSLVL